MKQAFPLWKQFHKRVLAKLNEILKIIISIRLSCERQVAKMVNNKKCMCCGSHTLPNDGIFEICPLCWWQDDGFQNDGHNFDGGANILSLKEYRKKWLAKVPSWQLDTRQK
jgi:hypothetical protein